MSRYNPKIHKRRSIRLKGYDYAQNGLYFITICVQNRVSLFGEIIDGQMHLNALGEIVRKEWENTAIIRKNCSLGAFIIMPNHLHGILSIDYALKENAEIGTFKSPSQTIGAIIRGFKGATTNQIKQFIREEAEKKNNNSKGKGPLETDFSEKDSPGTGEWQFAPTGFAPTGFALSKSIWQRNYYEHIIRSQKAYTNIKNYIINNPQKWEADKFYKK